MREALCGKAAQHHVPFEIFGNQNRKADAQTCLRLRLGPRHDFFGNVACAARLDRFSALTAEQSSASREDELETVVDFRHRAHGRARRFDAVGLIDGDGRRYAVDFVDLRTIAALQKLPGVSAERFDVAALPFGVERVVGKRAFARPRRAGDDGHRTRFNIQVQVAKVVLTGSADSDGTNVCSVGGVTHGKSIQVLEKDRKLGRKNRT